MGALRAAALIAHYTFWLLLAYGWAVGEVGVRGVAVFLCSWLVGFYELPSGLHGAGLFSALVAVLDIVLVFKIFKGDVRLT